MNSSTTLRSAKDIVAEARQRVRTCTPGEALERHGADDSCMILDVREPGEHQKACVDGAVNIPRGVLEFKFPEACGDPHRPILVHCASGGRAVLASRALGELGYTDVTAIDAPFDDVAGAFGAKKA